MSKIHHFTCTLLSPLVLTSRAATEGQIESLDYIPGAKFMGIVAKGYQDFDDQGRHDLFHNGAVKFSNGYPFATGIQLYPAPLSYFTPKGNKVTNGKVYLDHLMEKEARKELSEEGIQTKQVRSGYVDAAGECYLKTETDFQLKSAHDAEKRRSQEGQMYGYFSIPRGTVFAFSVEDPTGKYGDSIRKLLLGEHGIGRSRTAEYGRVSIKPLEASVPPTKSKPSTTDGTLVYAVSDLCFFDEFGQTKRPTAADLGFPGATIDWARTQVRSGEYQSWNSKRWNRNTDRWVTRKGTVFFVTGAKRDTKEALRWVGNYHQEGFGQIWIDPPFLQPTGEGYFRKNLEKAEVDKPAETTSTDAPSNTNSDLLELLKQREKMRNTEGHIYRRVNDFISNHNSKFSGISASQWNTLRNYANHAADDEALDQLIFSETSGFLHRGQSEKLWRGKREQLREVVNAIQKEHRTLFLQKLAAEMARLAKKQTA
jgi:hypothetical protein